MATKAKWNSIKKYTIIGLWASILLGITLFAFFLFSLSKELPPFKELENPQYDAASIIYSTNNKPFGRYYIENRVLVDYDEIPEVLVNSLKATEDIRFDQHAGIDTRALGRVLFKSIILQQDSGGGGSTITQQLAKLLFKRPSMRNKNKLQRMIILVKTKFKEWMTAVKLEKHFTKEEIIAMYLNKFEFINGAHGISAAASTYFNKSLEQLSVDEIAILVGMLKNPSLYNPIRFPKKAKERRNVVLNQMFKYKHLDKIELDSFAAIPVDMSSFNRKTQSEDPAPYFRAELTKWLKNLLANEAYYKPDGTPYNIYTDGLRIHTTIDLRYQELAEQAVFEHMAGLQERYFKHWKGRDLFKYEADPWLTELRREGLDRRVRSSERYQNLYHATMDASLDALKASFEKVRIGPLFIRSLIAVDNGEMRFSKMVERTIAYENEESYLKKVRSSSAWKNVKEAYSTFEEKYDKAFNTKIKMKVFAYNEAREEEVEMTPLDSVLYHYKHMQIGMLSMEPGTGYIRSWVGGVNHKYFKYDHINSRRQVGSTIKPFVYVSAIAFSGISPCQSYADVQYSVAPGESSFDIPEEWSPANANGKFTGNSYNLYHGLLYSKNSITVRLVKEMGTMTLVRDLLDKVGISKDKKHVNGEFIVPNVPAMSLGALDLTVMEMTGAYGTWSNNGVFVEPTFVTKIVDKNGKLIYAAAPISTMAINPMYNAVMVDMLKNNVSGKFGLGSTIQAGGKTGTTNDYADGWFMAITPSLVVGTWVGGDDKWIRFTNLNEGQGYVMARPAFKKFIKKIEENADSLGFDVNKQFHLPPAKAWELMDCEKFKDIEPEEEAELRLEEQEKFDVFDDEDDI